MSLHSAKFILPPILQYPLGDKISPRRGDLVRVLEKLVGDALGILQTGKTYLFVGAMEHSGRHTPNSVSTGSIAGQLIYTRSPTSDSSEQQYRTNFCRGTRRSLQSSRGGAWEQVMDKEGNIVRFHAKLGLLSKPDVCLIILCGMPSVVSLVLIIIVVVETFCWVHLISTAQGTAE